MISCEAISSSLHSGSMARPHIPTTGSHSHSVTGHAHILSSGSQSEMLKPKSKTHGNNSNNNSSSSRSVGVCDKNNLGFSSVQCLGNSFPTVHGSAAVVPTASDAKKRLSTGNEAGDEEEDTVEQDDEDGKKRRTSINSMLTSGTTATGTNVTSEEAGRPSDSPSNELPQLQSEEGVAVCNANSVLNIVPHVKDGECANTFHKAVVHQKNVLSENNGKNDSVIITTSKSTTEASPFEESGSNNNNNNNISNNKENNISSDGSGNVSKVSDNNKREIDATTARTAITLFLERLCEDNKAEPVLTSDFHSHRLPPMSVEDYVERIIRYSYVSGETIIVSIMLLLKYSFFVKHPVSIYNVHRLLITSTLLGVKMRDDLYFNNDYYSRIGGISNTEMNKLELRFCTVLEWDMWIGEEEYMEFVGLLLDLTRTLATQTHTTSAEPSTHTTVSHAGDRNNNNNKDKNDDEEVAESSETIEELRNRCWKDRFLPWLRSFYESAQNRRDRRQRLVQEDLYNEQRNSQTRHLGHPFDVTGTNGHVKAEQVILPAFFNLYNNTGSSGGVVVSGNATVVNVPSLASGVVSNLSSSSPQAQVQHVSQGSSTAQVHNSGFGIMERAVPPHTATAHEATAGTASPPNTKPSSGASSGISIHAKPYYYKTPSGGAGHQQHRQAGPLAGPLAGGWGPSGGGGSAAMRLTGWRPPQGGGASGFPPQRMGAEREDGYMRRGGKKRPKPDHYRDYR